MPVAGSAGTVVTITGTNFVVGATSVRFGAIDATPLVNVTSPTSLTVTVPAGATTGPISVETTNGTATSSSSFAILEGSGTATVLSGTAPYAGKNIFPRSTTGQTMQVFYAPPAAGTIEGLQIELPSAFGSAGAVVTVSGGGASPTIGFSGGTATISGLAATAAGGNVTINIAGLGTPDTATPVTNPGSYPVAVRSRGSGGTFAALASPPSALVTIPLANVRNFNAEDYVPILTNTVVAVEGVANVAKMANTGISAAIQDAEWGVTLFARTNVASTNLVRGNRYAAVGNIIQFRGLVQVEITNAADLLDLGANTDPAPVDATVSQFTNPPTAVTYQSRVVSIADLVYNGSPPWAANAVIPMSLASDSNSIVTVFIPANSTATNAPATNEPITVVGIGGQVDTNAPYDSGWQIQPRDDNDLQVGGPRITVSTNSITNLTSFLGAPGEGLPFQVNGEELTGDLTVEAQGDFQVSTNSATANDFSSRLSITVPEGGTLAPTDVWVRIAATAPDGAVGPTNVTVSGGGAGLRAVVVRGTVTDPNAPFILPVSGRAGLTNFTTMRTNASPAQSFSLSGNNLPTNISVVPPDGWQVATNDVNASFGTTVLVIPTNPAGVVSDTPIFVRLAGTNAAATNYTNSTLRLVSDSLTNSIQLVGSVTNPPPDVIVNTNALPPFTAILNTPSGVQSFTAGGTNLTTNITVTAPAGFTLSLAESPFAASNSLVLTTNNVGVVTNRSIFVRMNAFASPTNIATNNIVLTTTGRTNTVAVSGSVATPELTVSTTNLTGFTTFADTASTNQSFTAGGTNLVAPIVLTASNGYEISTNSTNGFSAVVTLGGSGGGVVASDNAGNYTSAPSAGSNGGFGFSPWTITNNVNGGIFLGNPAAAGIAGMPTNSFGLFANPANATNSVNASRAFPNALAVGESFIFQWGNNFDSGVSGNKGLNITTVGGSNVFNLNMGGNEAITLAQGTNPSTVVVPGYGTNAITFAFARTAANTFTVSAPTGRSNNSPGFTNTYTVTNEATGFAFYASGLQNDGNETNRDNAQPYFNNLEVSSPFSGGATNYIAPTTIYVRISAADSANPELLGGVTVATTGATPSPQVSLSGEVKALPTIPTVNTLQPFLAVSGQASPAQQLTVDGANLTNPLTVALPQFFQVSTNGTGGPYQDSPLVLSNTNSVGGLNTPIWLRVGSNAPITSELVATNLVLSSGSAATNLAVSYRVNSTNPSLSVSPTNLPAILSTQGSPSSGSFLLQGSTLSAGVTNTASSPFLVSTSSAGPFVGNLIVPLSSGLVSTNIFVQVATNTPPGVYSGNVAAASGATAASVTVVASVLSPGGAPQIVVSTNALTNFHTVEAEPSSAQTFLAAGHNLTNFNMVVEVPGPGNDYEISTNGTTFTNSLSLAVSGGQAGPTTIYVRLSGAEEGTDIAGAVNLTAGTASNSVVLSGKVDPLRPPAVTLVSPSNNPTIIAPGASVELFARVVDTNVAGGPGTLRTIEFLADGVPIPGAVTNNVVSPAQLRFPWTPGALPAEVTARAVDSDGLTSVSAAVTVRYPFEGEPVVGFQAPAANGTVEAVAPSSGGAFYIGGQFTELNDEPAIRVARVLADGAVDTSFIGAGPNNTVSVLAFDEASKGLYVGGAFSEVAGVTRRGLARLAVGQEGIQDGTLDPDFAPVLGAVSSPIVNAIVPQPDGKILVGGIFTTANGTASANLARFNPEDGTPDTTFIPSAPNGQVRSIAVQADGKILIAGSFGQVAGQDRRGLARLNADGTLDPDFAIGTGPDGGFNGPVWSVGVAADDRAIYAGGQFSAFNGRFVYNNLVKLSATGVLATRFNFAGSFAGGINNAVRDVQMRPDGNILISGHFTQISNSVLFPVAVSVGRVAQFEPGGTLRTSFNPVGGGANNTVLDSATLENGNLVLVGAFTQFNGQPYSRIVVLTGGDAGEPGMSFDEWRSEWFTPVELLDPAISGPDAVNGNPSGLSNFAVYALSGGDPRKVGPAILPTLNVAEWEDSERLALTAEINPEARADFTVEFSTDLRLGWEPCLEVERSETSITGYANEALHGASKQFLRLRITAWP